MNRVWRRGREFFLKEHRRLFLGLVFAAVVVPYVIIAAYSMYRSSESFTEATLQRRRTLADLAAQAQGSTFQTQLQTVSTFAKDIQMQATTTGRLDRAMQTVITNAGVAPLVSQMYVFAPDGSVRASLNPDGLTNASTRPWFPEIAEESGAPFISDLFLSNTDPLVHMLAIVVPMPSADPAKPDAYLTLEYRAELSFMTTNPLDLGEKSFVYFVDRNGNVANHPAYPYTGPLVTLASLPAVKEVLGGEMGVLQFYNPIENAERLTSYEPIHGTGWSVIVAQDADVAFQDRDTYVWQIGAIFLAGLVIQMAFGGLIVFALASVLRKRSEEEAILQNIGDGLVALDKRGRVVLMNSRAEEIVGQKYADIAGNDFAERVPLRMKSGPVARESRPTTRALRENERVVLLPSDDFSIVRPNGTTVPVAQTITPIRMGKEVIGAVVILRDVTQERAIEKTKNEFIWVASHQLRTPLTAVNWYTEMLINNRTDGSPEKLAKYTDVIQRESRRMTELVNALLNVSRLELGTIRNAPERLNVAEALRGVVDGLRWQAQAKNLAVEESYVPTVSMLVDPRLLNMVFENLMSNAVKYTPAGGRIRIAASLSKENDALEVTVADTGYGIPAAQHDKIFTKLFRADNVQEKVPEGTGLGLYIVKNVVQFLEGRVWFESTEGEGSVFHVVLPLKT